MGFMDKVKDFVAPIEEDDDYQRGYEQQGVALVVEPVLEELGQGDGVVGDDGIPSQTLGDYQPV